MSNATFTILIVDDEAVVRDSLRSWFEDDGFTVETAENGKAALKLVEAGKFDLALLDIKMPGMDGIELQRRLRKAQPDITVIIMTAYASVQTAVEALKDGAYDYILKPFDPDQLANLVRNVSERRTLTQSHKQLERKVDEEEQESRLVGISKEIRGIQELIGKVAQTDSTALILGESGTGKELIARAIHNSSRRRLMPLVTVNCGALPEGVLESELFGHEKGAFTGAQSRRKGRFELADGGTIFLDEIGDISAKTQINLLRVLEEKEVTRVGGNDSIEVDFRLIAATNKNLQDLVEKGEFRQDLFYRLNVFTIDVPPLRDRPDDIMPLALHFLEKLNHAMGKRIAGFSKDAEGLLMNHSWPGNVRELENAIERAMVICPGTTIDSHCFPFTTGELNGSGNEASLEDIERDHIRSVLHRHNWNVSESARVLEIDRVTLYNKISKYDLKRPGKE